MLLIKRIDQVILRFYHDTLPFRMICWCRDLVSRWFHVPPHCHSSSSFLLSNSKHYHDHHRLEICRDRHKQWSYKNMSSCVNFSRKQHSFLQNLRRNMKFTHLFDKINTFFPKLLKFYIFSSIIHLYWNLRCFIVGKIKCNLRIFSV